jgi:hypothetical protein
LYLYEDSAKDLAQYLNANAGKQVALDFSLKTKSSAPSSLALAKALFGTPNATSPSLLTASGLDASVNSTPDAAAVAGHTKRAPGTNIHAVRGVTLYIAPDVMSPINNGLPPNSSQV